MKLTNSFRPQDIRNIALLGHGGSGKTTLAEALLHKSGAITRMGSVEGEDTVSDFEPEAKSHQQSISSSVLFATREGREINIIDTPGHPEFVGHALAALPAVETAVIVVDAVAGIQLNTRRLFHAAGELGLARMVVVNKIDLNLEGLPDLLAQLKHEFGARLHAINLPTRGGADVIDCFDSEAGQADFGSVAEVHREMLESSVEVDDAELERYFAGEPIDLPSLRRCFVTAMTQGHVVPVLFTSAKNEVGIDDFVHILVEEGPSPIHGRPRRLRLGDEVIEVPCDADKPFLAHVFKVASDQHTGRVAMMRILQGTFDGATNYICAADKKPRKAGAVLKMEGRDHPEMEVVAYAGDIVALAKVDDIKVGQILHAPGLPDDYTPVDVKLPQPVLAFAIAPVNKKDDVKLSGALAQLAEEDPTLLAGQDEQTREFVVRGLGELHLRIALERLRNRYRIEVSTKPPAIAYRETITAKAEGHYRHKKQTGGAGQFAEVFLRVEPLERGSGFQFASEVVGGVIPKQFISSVEKGVLDALAAGTVTGAPIQDVRVVVYDGKSHPVDSKDIAFRTAGKYATRDALTRARPVVLEPIANLEISAPEAMVGAITADMKNLRARVLGVETTGKTTVLRVQAPLAELGNYGGQLRGVTGGHGSFALELAGYEPVPPQVQQRLAEAYKPAAETE